MSRSPEPQCHRRVTRDAKEHGRRTTADREKASPDQKWPKQASCHTGVLISTGVQSQSPPHKPSQRHAVAEGETLGSVAASTFLSLFYSLPLSHFCPRRTPLPHFIHPASVHSSPCALQRVCSVWEGGGVPPPTPPPTHAGGRAKKKEKCNLINEQQPSRLRQWAALMKGVTWSGGRRYKMPSRAAVDLKTHTGCSEERVFRTT